MARRQAYRGKPKKRPNRYNPLAPNWAEVHGRYGLLDALLGPARPASYLDVLLATPQPRTK